MFPAAPPTLILLHPYTTHENSDYRPNTIELKLPFDNGGGVVGVDTKDVVEICRQIILSGNWSFKK